MNRLIQVTMSVITLSLLLGCFGNAPLKTLEYSAQDNTKGENLIIFLRGLGGSHRDFDREGFVHEVRQDNLPYDMTAPNAHFGYYFSETITTRLKTDIVSPAIANGYDKIWLVGISMGGLGSLMYAREHPDEIEGIYLIAPFLGYEDIIEEITSAGGLQQWQPGEYDPNDDWQRMFWHWLKQCSEGTKQRPVTYLGFGTEDGFNSAHQLLASQIPKDHVFRIAGGHDKETMKKLWLLFLETKTIK